MNLDMSDRIEWLMKMIPYQENLAYWCFEVALRSGFSSRSFYSTTFTKAYGISPAQYRLIHKVV